VISDKKKAKRILPVLGQVVIIIDKKSESMCHQVQLYIIF